MKRTTIAQRITFNSAVLITLLLTVCGISIVSVSNLMHGLTKVSENSLPALIENRSLLSSLTGLRDRVYRHLLAKKAEEITGLDAGIDKGVQEVRKAIDAYAKTASSGGKQTADRLVVASFDRFTGDLPQALELSRQMKKDEALAALEVSAFPALEEAIDLLNEAALATGKSTLTTTSVSARQSQWSFSAMWLMGLVAVLGGATFCWFVVRNTDASLRGLLLGLEQESSLLAGSAGSVASSSQSIAQGASEQASSLEEISASIEEMSAMTRRNSEHSVKAGSLMSETSLQVDRSNLALKDMLSSMNSIKASSEKIAKINKTIDEIAFQTNILALNAAVEAARAGEAGMGFAVVADEVRNLAQRSAIAAKDTAALIEEAIENSLQGGKNLDLVASAIAAITKGASGVNDLLAELNEASKQQLQGISQVSEAISQVSKVTQQAAATAEEGSAASQELTAQARSIRTSVENLEILAGVDAASTGNHATSFTEMPMTRQETTLPVSFHQDMNAEDLLPMDTSISGNFHHF